MNILKAHKAFKFQSNDVTIIGKCPKAVTKPGVILPLILAASKELLTPDENGAHLLKIFVNDVEA